MSTLFGKYLDKLNANKSKISRATDLKIPRINDLSNKTTAKPLPHEYFKIILTAILQANMSEKEFNNSFNEIFPNRPQVNFLQEFAHLSPETQFILKHALAKKTIEEKVGMADGKVTRLGSEDVKEVLAVELICFIEGLGLDVLQTLKSIYGDVNLKDDNADLIDK